MKSFWYGLSALLLTSAFFTQFFQDRALLTGCLKLDWKIQFAGEIALSLAALAAGAFSGQGKPSEGASAGIKNPHGRK